MPKRRSEWWGQGAACAVGEGVAVWTRCWAGSPELREEAWTFPHLLMEGKVRACLAPQGFLSPAFTSYILFQVLPLFVFWTIDLSATGEGPCFVSPCCGFPFCGTGPVPVGRSQVWVPGPSGVV